MNKLVPINIILPSYSHGSNIWYSLHLLVNQIYNKIVLTQFLINNNVFKIVNIFNFHIIIIIYLTLFGASCMQLTLVGETGGDHATERFFGLKSNKSVLNEFFLTITLHAAYFLVVS